MTNSITVISIIQYWKLKKKKNLPVMIGQYTAFPIMRETCIVFML